jgi:hypothetical protein
MIWIVVVLVIVVAALVVAMRARKTRQLQGSFGREYDRTVAKAGDQGDAESELVERQDRRERLTIVPLTVEAHARYGQNWQAIQTSFVDAPQSAVEGADQLVTRVMRERGYPIVDFDQRADDVSVDHPDVVEHYYRAGHAFAARIERGTVDTEDMRLAFMHYRVLFEQLLESIDDHSAAPSDPRPDTVKIGGRWQT